MEAALHLPTLREIQRGLAAGDEKNAFDSLSVLRPTADAPVSPQALEALEARSQAAREIFAQAAASAEAFAAGPIPALPFSLYRLYEETGDRLQYEHIYFGDYTRRSTDNALCWLRTRDDRYRRALEDGLWALCDAYTWALPAHLWGNSLRPEASEPAYADGGRDELLPHTPHNSELVDLFAAMHAQEVAQMLYVFGDELSPIVVRRLRTELQRRIFDPILQFNRPHFWETCENNWAAVCAGSVGCAALYSIRDSALLAPLLTRMCQAMEGYLAGFDEDGICEEGLSYWNYGFRHFVMFAELLRKRTAGTVDLFRLQKVQRIACFPQKAVLNGSDAVSFADCPPTVTFDPALLHYLHRRVPQAALPADECMTFRMGYWFSYACFTLEEFEPAWMGAPGFPDATAVYRKAEWLVSRCTIRQKACGFAAKGGHNLVSHNHNDAGSFLIDINGQQLLCDAGCGCYTRQYFDPALRYGLIACGSQGHSVPLIDGCTQYSGLEYRAVNTRIEASDAADTLCCDIAPAYGLKQLHQLQRDLCFDKKAGIVTLQDRFVLDGGTHRLTERFTTWQQPRTEDGCVIIEHDGDRLILQADCAGEPVPHIHAEPFPLHDLPEDRPLWLIDYEWTTDAAEASFALTIRMD